MISLCCLYYITIIFYLCFFFYLSLFPSPWSAVSARQSFIHRFSPHRLLILQLCQDGPHTLLLTQSHPGNWLTDLDVPAFLIPLEKVASHTPEFDRTCKKGTTSRLALPFNKMTLVRQDADARTKGQTLKGPAPTLQFIWHNTCSTHPAILVNYINWPD